ncbi:hypothetical protein Tco_1200682 [Tanacetum coccineum]
MRRPTIRDVFAWVSDDEPEASKEAPQSLEHAPPSLAYMPDPEHPPSLDYVPCPEYHTLSSGYVADSDPSKEDPKEDPEEDPTDYLTNGGDDEEDSFGNDDDDKEEEDEASEEEEEEHLALANSTMLPVIDPVPSIEDTKTFETDEFAPTPPLPISPRTKVPFS